jgi:hypothetical protein
MTALAAPRGNVSLYARLITMAWAIEIIAAMIGFALALSRLAPPEGEQLPLFMAVQGAMPFFAVMVIELTKIPLASVFYTVEKLRWRLLFFFSLALTMVITFETFFIGFEQYQSLLMRPLREVTTQIAEQKRIIAGSTQEQGTSTAFVDQRAATADAYRENQASINGKFDKLDDELKSQREEILRKYEVKAGPIKSEQERVDADLVALEKRYEAELQRIQSERAAAIGAALENKTAETDNDIARLTSNKQEQQQVRAEAAKERKSIREASALELAECWNCVSEEKRLEDGLAKVDRDLERNLAELKREQRRLENKLSGATSGQENIQSKFVKLEERAKDSYELDKSVLLEDRNRLAQTMANVAGGISGADQRKIDALNAELKQLSADRQTELGQEKARFDAQQVGFDHQMDNAQNASDVAANARTAMIPLCTELNDKVAENQIFRLAMQLFGSDDACALEEEQLSTTKAIWFGSLAIIVSALGTILALAAFVVRHPPTSSRPLGMRFRLAFLAIRKRMNNPRIVTEKVEIEKIVEVTKEVPVDRVAFKEVPVEVVKREVVHIPVYTNDPSLLGKNYETQSEQ